VFFVTSAEVNNQTLISAAIAINNSRIALTHFFLFLLESIFSPTATKNKHIAHYAEKTFKY
jgi:hypothetical protein